MPKAVDCTTRLAGIAIVLLAFGLCASIAHAQSLAFTFDDGPRLAETPRLSPQQRNQSLLDALARHRVKAALFVTAGNGANQVAGYALAKAWGQAGHAIGNHTMTHPDLHSAKTSLEQYQQEILDCDTLISALPGYQKWFRYTFLREGNTPDKRDGMRTFLKQQGYRNAYVSLDTSDWRLDEKLIDVLRENPDADLTPIKLAYLAHIRQRALAYRELSQKLQGRDIAQVLLLHHNLINALWLGDVIAQFKDMGWWLEHHHPGRRFRRSHLPAGPRTRRPRPKPAAVHGAHLGLGQVHRLGEAGRRRGCRDRPVERQTQSMMVAIFLRLPAIAV